jgi:hypothetical protein
VNKSNAAKYSNVPSNEHVELLPRDLSGMELGSVRHLHPCYYADQIQRIGSDYHHDMSVYNSAEPRICY